jgi:hypothetical protein
MDAELSGFIAGSRNHSAVGGPADNDAFVLKPGIIQLFHGGKKSIHVDMQNHSILDFGFKRLTDCYNPFAPFSTPSVNRQPAPGSGGPGKSLAIYYKIVLF